MKRRDFFKKAVAGMAVAAHGVNVSPLTRVVQPNPLPPEIAAKVATGKGIMAQIEEQAYRVSPLKGQMKEFFDKYPPLVMGTESLKVFDEATKEHLSQINKNGRSIQKVIR